MSSKTEKIISVLERHGVMETPDIAVHSNIPAYIVERVLIKLEDSGRVFAVGDESWQLNG